MIGRVRIAPDVRIVSRSPNQIELRRGLWSTSSLTLRDADGGQSLSRILYALGVGGRIDEIARSAGVSFDAVTQVADSLTAAGFMEQALLPSKRARETRRVRLICAARIVAHFQSFVDRLGGLAVDVVVDEIAPFADRGFRLASDEFEVNRILESYAAWENDCVVVAMPHLDPVAANNINVIAHAYRCTVLFAFVDGPYAVLGPLVVPGSTGCFRCAEMRVLDNMRDHLLYDRFIRDSHRLHQKLGDPTVSEPIADVIFTMAAYEATTIVSTGSSFLGDRLLTLFAPTFEFAFHHLARKAECPVCGDRNQPEEQLFADLASVASMIAAPST